MLSLFVLIVRFSDRPTDCNTPLLGVEVVNDDDAATDMVCDYCYSNQYQSKTLYWAMSCL